MILALRVYDENEINNQQSSFVAYSTIPVRNLRSGIRSVALFDEKGLRKGDYQFCTLLLRIKIVEADDIEEEENAAEKPTKSKKGTKGG